MVIVVCLLSHEDGLDVLKEKVKFTYQSFYGCNAKTQ